MMKNVHGMFANQNKMNCGRQFFQIIIIFIILIFIALLNLFTKKIMFKLKIVSENIFHTEELPKYVTDNDVEIKEQYLKQCDCTRGIEAYSQSISSTSTCSSASLIRGRHQKVVSFTFFEG